MSITAVCPSCGKRFQAPAQFAGKRVKCKQCGVVFQIAAQGGGAAAPAAGTAGTQRNQTNSQSKAGDQIDIDDSLAQLESVASFAGEDAPPPQASRAGSKVGSKAGAAGGTSAGAGAGGKPRIVGRDELNTKMEANPDAEEVELEGPTDVSYRANVLKFRYPGAKIIDQWLPLFLLVLGFGLMAMVISPRDQTYGIRWIAAARFVIPVLLYRILILPMAMAMVHKAGQEMRYQMPPNEKLRGFATYLPALAFAFTFWTASGGSVLGLILGAFIGLALSSAALWLLFRLRDEEVSTSIGYGAGGFGIGMGIAIALILGLNLLMTVVLTQTKSQAKVPASPFGPNLSWVSTSSSSTAVANAKPAKAAPKPAAPTDTQASAPTKSNIDSAVLSDVQTSPVPLPATADAAMSTLIQPLSGSSVVAIATESNGVTVEPWDLSTGQKTTGEPLKLKTRPASKFAISTDGKRIAWVATFPKHSVQVWSFDTGKATMAIDWEAARGDPELIGFSAPNRLLLRWGNTSASADIDVVNVDAKARVATFKVNQLQGKHPIAVSPAAQRLLVASKVKGIPTLIQYDLNDGQPILYTKIVDLDPALPVDARGLAYSNDGKRMAIYIENPEGALLVSYDSDGSQKPVSLVYPDGPTPGVAHDNFADNALTSLDPSPCWLIYGDAVIDAKTNDVLANLGVKNVIANRVLDNDHVELVTSDGSKVQVKVATIDRSKLQALTATPTPAPQVSLH